MAIAIIFLLGIGNFAACRAVLASGHPLLARLPSRDRRIASRLVLGFEFGLLVASLALVRSGWSGAALGYGLYTAINGLSAWLVLTRRL